MGTETTEKPGLNERINSVIKEGQQYYESLDTLGQQAFNENVELTETRQTLQNIKDMQFGGKTVDPEEEIQARQKLDNVLRSVESNSGNADYLQAFGATEILRARLTSLYLDAPQTVFSPVMQANSRLKEISDKGSEKEAE